MFTFEYKFYPISFSESFINEFDEEMNFFLSALCKNGQILRDLQNTVVLEDHYACRIVAPEIDSLDKKYYNKYCRNSLDDLVNKSVKSPDCFLVGKNYELEKCCECSNPENYVLYSEHSSSATPILCAKCQKVVPLYTFPKTYDNEEYYDLLMWQKVYRACDIQFMSGDGERHAYNMMNNLDSPLSIEGSRICSFLEEKTGKAFYYFLFKYYRNNKSACPKCGNNWINMQSSLSYDCVCNNCRLVSNNIF